MASKEKAGTVTPNVVGFPTAATATPAPVMFGSLIKERRKKAKLSQKDFADMMHVTRNTVINWEADKSKPDYSLIPEVCSLLNIQIHELFHMQAENGCLTWKIESSGTSVFSAPPAVESLTK